MAWSSPFKARGPNSVTCWGYTFDLTASHLSKEQLEPLKHSYDTLGERCLSVLDAICPPERNALPRSSTESATSTPAVASSEEIKATRRDLYALLETHHSSDPDLDALWKQINTVPSWVNWEQIARGQDVFYRYGGANLTGLAYQSLLGGMGAARVVETLARTGGFSTKVARRRLFETTQHILECTRGLESIQPGGRGFASTVRVRLLHAAVRRRILKLAAERPAYYNVKEWGVPVNDLDSIATIGTFSATLIWLSLPRQGIFMREQEVLDYIALWRYIGYVIGCPTEGYFNTPERAKAMMEMLLMYEIAPSETSKVLANNIILSLADNPPANASADFLVAGARWLNGDALSDELGLMKPHWYYKMLVLGQCIFLSFWSYFYRSFEGLDRRHIQGSRKLFWKLTVESDFGLGGNETGFEFQYVPEYDTLTEVTSTRELKPHMRGIELRNLKALIMGVGALSIVGWSLGKLGSLAVRTVWSVGLSVASRLV